MSGFRRFCNVIFALAGLLAFAALSLTWFGPWRATAAAMLNVEFYAIGVFVCLVITAVGLVLTLLRALFVRKVRLVEVATVDGGAISVTKDAIAAQATHIVEADGTCTAARVRVDAKPRGHVRVHVRVLPHESVDVVVKGAQLHEELLDGLAAVCGDKVENVSLEFVEPEAVTVHVSADESEATADEANASAAPAAPESTSEITVPMGGSAAPAHDAQKEA